MSDFAVPFASLLRARFPYIYVGTWEEERVLGMIRETSRNAELVRTPRTVFTWSVTDGLVGPSAPAKETCAAPLDALGALPGLGPEVARRAVAMRDGDGPFKSLEDFRYRLGLGIDAMIKISPYVSVISMSKRPGGGSTTRTGGRIVDV